MEEMEAMGAPVASLFGEAEPHSLNGLVRTDSRHLAKAHGARVRGTEEKLGRGAAK